MLQIQKNEPKSFRPVFECVKCSLKFKIKPENCNCQSNIFRNTKVYSLDKILSYKQPINVMIGGRRFGKTYAVAEYCVQKWKNLKRKFCWIRRHKTEMKKALEAFEKLGFFFDRTGVFYPEKIKNEKGKTEIIRNYIGIIITLSTASNIRGGEFNEFATLVIDEYGDEFGRKLKNEFTMLNSLIVSILDQKEDTVVFVLSNNTNRFLPLFQHIGVKWDQEWTRNWKVGAIVHLLTDEKREWYGAMAKWLQSTDYYNYAVFNKPMDYDEFLIEKYKLDNTQEFCFKFYNIKNILRLTRYGIGDNEFAIDECVKCNHDWIVIDTISMYRNVKQISKTGQLRLKQLYATGKLRFTTPEIKNSVIDWMTKILYISG